MTLFKKNIYAFVRYSIKTYLKLFLEFKVWGKSTVPKGPKIFCSNHFSSTDPFFAITLMREPVHMVIGPGFSVPIIRFFLKHGEQINALPENRKNVISDAKKYLDKGESIYIFPEGDLNNQETLLEFYKGMAKIQRATGMPILPIGIIAPKRYVREKGQSIRIGETVYKTLVVGTGGKYYANIGKLIQFNDREYTDEEISDIVKEQIQWLIDDIKINKFWS